ncbi:MAG: hypothetical protein RLZZ70_715 [Candidatus Parcubacteria bacterium]|jgi:ribulose-phosphate 3-epimerase
MSAVLVPAIIPASQHAIEAFVAALPGVTEIHVDVVDGNFVPTTSWPYLPTGDPSLVASTLAPVTLEVDLMVKEPLSAAEAWLAAGADMLVFHVESISLHDFIYMVTISNATIGIAANNDTPFATLAPYLELTDYVQVMGIREIGKQGQSLDERVFARVEQIKALAPQVLISIDGSVNETTLPTLLATKAERYIVGSAVYGADDPLAAYQRLLTLISTQGDHGEEGPVGIL